MEVEEVEGTKTKTADQFPIEDKHSMMGERVYVAFCLMVNWEFYCAWRRFLLSTDFLKNSY